MVGTLTRGRVGSARRSPRRRRQKGICSASGFESRNPGRIRGGTRWPDRRSLQRRSARCGLRSGGRWLLAREDLCARRIIKKKWDFRKKSRGVGRCICRGRLRSRRGALSVDETCHARRRCRLSGLRKWRRARKEWSLCR